MIQPSYIRNKLDEHMTGRANHVALIWCMLSFESWCRQTGVFGGVLGAPRREGFLSRVMRRGFGIAHSH